MTEQNERTVAQEVRRYLADHHPDGVTFDVIEGAIRKEEHWWYVPIRPSVEPTKRYQYYEILADVEAELDENEQLKVLLAPIPAEIEQAPAA
jgi:hypothetical protein